MLGLLAVAMFMLAACTNQSEVTHRQVGMMTGLVTDMSTNEPIAGAKVRIRSTPFTGALKVADVVQVTVYTDKDGAFSSKIVPNGDLQILATQTGYKTPEIQTWALPIGGTGNVVFELSPGTDPPGKFIDDDDKEAWPADYNPSSGG
jgi:hypothetical protein